MKIPTVCEKRPRTIEQLFFELNFLWSFRGTFGIDMLVKEL